MKRFLAVSLLVAACGTPAVTLSELNPTEATTARTVKIAPPALEFTAVVTSRISSVISTQVQGRIKELKLHSGQLIKAGELVASIDKSELQTELVAAQAAEKSAMMQEGVYGAQSGALHKKAVAESRLVALGVSAPISSATADAEYAQNGAQAGAAAAKAAEARANREQKEKDLANTDITAPISGVVTNIKAHEGENAQKGAPLARVFDPSDLIVRFAVPKEHRTELRLGQRVELDVEGNTRPVWATVTNISGVQEPPINFIVVEADIDDSKLAPGELSVATVGRVKIADARDARGAKP